MYSRDDYFWLRTKGYNTTKIAILQQMLHTPVSLSADEANAASSRWELASIIYHFNLGSSVLLVALEGLVAMPLCRKVT